MSNDGGVPSRNEIEAMLSGGSSDGGDSSGGSEPVAPALPGETIALLNRMSERLETLGAAMERIAQLERGLTETNSAVRLTHQNMQKTAGHIQLVSKRVEGILLNLKATLGYRAKNIYVCGSCHSKGKVAARVKCTHCGQENWWGWWPPSKSQGDGDSVPWLWQRLR